MRRLIRKALTKRRMIRAVEVEEPPSEALVYGVTFAVAALGALTALQIAHMIFLGTWSSEVFAAITALIGTIIGVFFGKKG